MLPVRGTARFLCAGAAGGRHRCRCSVRGCRPSPLAAVVAVVVVAGSWWLVPCATYRLPRSFAGRFRRQRRGLLPVPARPGGLGKFLRRASPSFWAVRGWLPPWPGCGGLPGCYFPRPRSILRHTGAGAAARQHLATSSRSLFQKEKHTGSQGKPVAAVAAPRRESPVVVLAVPPRRPCLPGRTPAPHRHCRLPRVLDA